MNKLPRFSQGKVVSSLTQQKPKQPAAPPAYRPCPAAPKVLQRQAVAEKQSGIFNARPTPSAPPVYRPQPMPKVLQRKTAQGQPVTANAATRKQPVAPPVYRPQPTPLVLQAKMAQAAPQPSSQSGRMPVALPVYRPQPVPKVLQAKMREVQPPARPQPSASHPAQTGKPSPVSSIYRPQTFQSLVSRAIPQGARQVVQRHVGARVEAHRSMAARPLTPGARVIQLMEMKQTPLEIRDVDPEIMINAGNSLESEWAQSAPIDRMKIVLKAALQVIVSVGVPMPLKTKFMRGLSDNAQVVPSTWSLNVRAELFEQTKISSGKISQLITSLIHEFRHLEQIYTIARHMASGKDLSADEIAKLLNIPREIADKAKADSRILTTTQVQDASRLYESRYGSRAQESKNIREKMRLIAPEIIMRNSRLKELGALRNILRIHVEGMKGKQKTLQIMSTPMKIETAEDEDLRELYEAIVQEAKDEIMTYKINRKALKNVLEEMIVLNNEIKQLAKTRDSEYYQIAEEHDAQNIGEQFGKAYSQSKGKDFESQLNH